MASLLSQDRNITVHGLEDEQTSIHKLNGRCMCNDANLLSCPGLKTHT